MSLPVIDQGRGLLTAWSILLLRLFHDWACFAGGFLVFMKALQCGIVSVLNKLHLIPNIQNKKNSSTFLLGEKKTGLIILVDFVVTDKSHSRSLFCSYITALLECLPQG